MTGVGPICADNKFYPYVIGGKSPFTLKAIYGDGNCYFRSISYILSGVEKFYMEVRKAVCDFIKVFDGDLKPFLRKRKGKAYIKDSQMETKWNMGD